MNCAYSDNFLNLTFYLDLLLVAGSHPSKDETSLLLSLILLMMNVNIGTLIANRA